MSACEFSVDDGLAILTLNSPPQNRFVDELSQGLRAAITELDKRNDVRVLLLRANGPDFSHGGNIESWPGLSSEYFSAALVETIAIANTLQDLPYPVIAAVQGYCGGGGFELALCGDIIIAADNARFCHSEASIGVFTFLGGIQRVAERVGRTRAMEWAVTAEQVDASTALSAGLINEVSPVSELEATAGRWAKRLRNSATLAHAAHKRLLRAWSNGGVRAADALLAEMSGPILHSQDTQNCLPEAIQAAQAGLPRPDFDFIGR